MSSKASVISLLNLPFEIREQILGKLFFPNESYPKVGLDHASEKPAIVRQIILSEEHYGHDRSSSFQTSVIRTCRQLQHEAENILYASSHWVFKVQSWRTTYSCHDRLRRSRKRLEAVPKRLRGMIRWIDVRYDLDSVPNFDCFEYTILMKLLTRECPGLQHLRLLVGQQWRPLHTQLESRSPRFSGCSESAGSVQGHLQIKPRDSLDVDSLSRTLNVYTDLDIDFRSCLQTCLTRSTVSRPISSSPATDRQGSSFAFLRLPKSVRDQVYRYAMIPSDGLIHPYLKPYFDDTTRDVLPLFLVSRQIHCEAEALLVKAAVFHSPEWFYDRPLRRIVELLYERQISRQAPPLKFTLTFKCSDGIPRRWKGKRRRESRKPDAPHFLEIHDTKFGCVRSRMRKFKYLYRGHLW